MTLSRQALAFLGILTAALLLHAAARAQEEAPADDTYTEEEITTIAGDFFGETSEALAKVIQKVFNDFGQPNAYVAGEEGSGAIGVGLRYGKGVLTHKTLGSEKVFWTGPSIGFDVGGNASKVFTLVYYLDNFDDIYQRFPAVEGSYYFVAGLGVNYQRKAGIVLAPIRTGVGLRAGANLGYLHYTEKRRWMPF